MNLPRASVARPIFTGMVTLMVVVLGLVSLDRLRIDLLPDVELPTVTVRTELEGASPEVVERLVTQIVEEVVATVPGVEEISSESSEGSSTVRVRFSWGTDLDAASIELQAQLESEIDELPEEVGRPRVSKFDVSSFPVVILGISSKLDPVELTALVEDQVRYRFARVPGVAQVDVWGGFNREVRIELDPLQLNALGVPLDRILTAVRDANLDRPAGKLEEGRFDVTLRAPSEFVDLDEIRQTVLLERDGAVVTQGQVARVVDTYEKLTRLVRVDGDRGIRVAVRKQADANTVAVSRRILETIDEVNALYPELRVVPVSNQGNFIERSISNVAQSVLYGSGLAVLVLLFFLGSLRSTLVISLAIPISVVATFALVYFGGFTLNLMTLGGLALGVGMMVDSSVVVLENVFRRHVEDGLPVRRAAVEGASEVATAIVASTITTLVIFLPLAFVRGVAGVLFQELAYVIVFALVCSLLVSLSLVPVLASRLLEGADRAGGPRSAIARGAARGLAQLDEGYRRVLGTALDRPWTTVLVAALMLGSSLTLFPLIGSEFLPPSDEGEVRVSGEMEIGTRLDLVDRQTRQMEALVLPAVPELVSSVVTVGASGRNASAASTGEISLTLVPAAQRERSNVEVADELRRLVDGRIPGMVVRTRAPQGQFLLERVLGQQEGLQVEVRGYDLDALGSLAERAAEVVRSVDGVTDVKVSRDAGIPQQEVRVDRQKIADVGLSVRQVSDVIQTAFAGSRAGEFRAGGNSYRILVQLADAERRSLDEVLDLTLQTPAGDLVALRNLVSTVASRGPLVIERKNQQRLVTVQAGVTGRDLGSVAKDVEAGLAQIARPSGHDLEVAGSVEEQAQAFRELVISFALALALVYMVLACQYESLRDPLVVMLSVPVAAVGVLLTLWLTNTTFNLQTYIGCIMLGGIVVNNAILLVDQAGRLVADGSDVRAAVAEAGRRRLRPILMTTLTTVLALVPLALGVGEGADAQAPLARTVVGGLTGSTLITLVLIPAVYLIFHRRRAQRS
ncbi:efflux RND transporter permease subunit [Engelhardtia mirabilis]|uniref:Multidrug resistance protein MdtC n=1 Tax=Engelhardtia mirabilis TaxID=2528011 RepID=A0A518BME9_9BACT|nr:Multidrug resistance protein MdtC [Planctomycetes bacterium Pla133]QDV02484.1 Multidrug resistance protein MdtC [Planctomycetes bacterium Pla86]